MSHAQLDEALRLAGDRLSAADVLDRAPHRAESIRILSRGLRAIEAALELFDAADSSAQPLSRTDREALSQLRRRLDGAPEGDGQLSPADIATRRAARRLAFRALRRLQAATRSRSAALARRVAWLLPGLLVLGAVALALHLRDRIEVAASDRYSDSYPARNVIDGNRGSEWLAPDGATAWLEVTFRKPTAVSAVRIVNARNAPYDDRATKDLQVTLFHNDEVLTQATLTLLGVGTEADAHSVPIAGVGVTRVRLSALSYYGKGAGFAEVEVVERSP